jgi:uncharacterized membrane protein
LTLARAIHVVFVVAWIGGVYLVTMMILPAVRGLAELEGRIKYFQDTES